MVRTEGLTRAHALGASPHACGAPVGLLASRTPDHSRPRRACSLLHYVRMVLAERRWLISGFNAGPADLLARPNPPMLANNLVVGPGVAPGLPACRAGVVTGSLADEKLAAEIGFAPISFALTGRGTTVVLLGSGGQARIRTVISSVWERDPCCWTTRPKKNGATDGCCPRYLLLDMQATLLVCPRSHGQVAGICTRFSGFTGRCPAHWATHLIKWSERRDSHSRDLGPRPSA